MDLLGMAIFSVIPGYVLQISLDFLNGKLQFENWKNGSYSQKYVTSESGTSANLCKENDILYINFFYLFRLDSNLGCTHLKA